MSIDILYVVDGLRGPLGDVIFALAAARAIQMGRNFVNPVYRSRAFWSAGLAIVAILNDLSGSLNANGLLGFFLSFGPFVLLLTAILAFVDKTVLVAMLTDFFHRDILSWHRARKWIFVAFALSLILFFVASFGLPSSESAPGSNDPLIVWIGFYQFSVALPAIFVFATACLGVGARRTPDRTLKNHIRFLAYGLALFVGSFVIGFITNLVLPFDLVNDVVGVLSVYMVYRAVMSLSPVARLVAQV